MTAEIIRPLAFKREERDFMLCVSEAEFATIVTALCAHRTNLDVFGADLRDAIAAAAEQLGLPAMLDTTDIHALSTRLIREAGLQRGPERMS